MVIPKPNIQAFSSFKTRPSCLLPVRPLDITLMQTKESVMWTIRQWTCWRWSIWYLAARRIDRSSSTFICSESFHLTLKSGFQSHQPAWTDWRGADFGDSTSPVVSLMSEPVWFALANRTLLICSTVWVERLSALPYCNLRPNGATRFKGHVNPGASPMRNASWW